MDGEGLKMWGVVANILNKRHEQPTMGGLPAWWLGED
jgi:hypothetical protein